jgi:diacylglycerol O-acyltransferase
MTVDRMSALDGCFLRLESQTAPMHVGWVLLADGQAPALDDLRSHISGRLERLPRFRRRVISAPFGLHDPVWVDDTEFDLAHHVRGVRIRSSPGSAELRRLAAELLSVPLGRDRPLWRLHLVEGLRDQRFALVGLAHHALVDGIAALEMAQLLLDPQPASGPPPPGRPFSPAPVPGIFERARTTAAARVRLTRSAGSLAMRALANPASMGELAGELHRLGSALATVGVPAPRTSLNRSIGPQRSVAFADLSLHLAKELGRRCNATINDVVLATAALALGRYLRRLGEAHPWLRVLVPVNTRSADGASSLGNEVSVMFVELPIGERDPRAVLEEVTRQTRAHKRGAHASAIDRVLRACELAPAPLRDGIAWLVTRPQTFNAVVSNVPGPRMPLYLLGRRVTSAYPAVPLTHGQGLSIGVLSYCGALHVGLYGDPEVVPELIDVARDFRRAFDALRDALLPRSPRPPTARRGAPRRGAPVRRVVLVPF